MFCIQFLSKIQERVCREEHPGIKKIDAYHPYFIEMKSKETRLYSLLLEKLIYWFRKNLIDLLVLGIFYCRNWVRKRAKFIMEELWVNGSLPERNGSLETSGRWSKAENCNRTAWSSLEAINRETSLDRLAIRLVFSVLCTSENCYW